MKKTFDIKTGSWTPKIIKVENGFIVNIESPTSDIIETYVYETFQDVMEFIADNFELDINNKDLK